MWRGGLGAAYPLPTLSSVGASLAPTVDLEVPIQIGSGKSHLFDLATRERDIVAECKAFTFTATGNNPSAKMTTLREATMYLRSIPGNVKPRSPAVYARASNWQGR
jgi:hypothetical protein